MDLTLTDSARELLIELAQSEIRSIERGHTTYGTPEDNLGTVEELDAAIEFLQAHGGPR